MNEGGRGATPTSISIFEKIIWFLTRNDNNISSVLKGIFGPLTKSVKNIWFFKLYCTENEFKSNLGPFEQISIISKCFYWSKSVSICTNKKKQLVFNIAKFNFSENNFKWLAILKSVSIAKG